MTAAMVNYIISLVDSTCFLLIVFYFITRSELFYDLLKAKGQFQKRIILVLLFGALSVYGVAVAAVLECPAISVSIIGPIAGAISCGFWVGAGAGLIGAAAGMLVHGSATQAAILFAGVAAGAYCAARVKQSSVIADAAAVSFVCAILAELAILNFRPLDAHDGILIPFSSLVTILGVTGMIFLIERLIEERQTSAAKELIDSEIRIASDIQMSVVPKTFPPLPHLPDLDVFAVLKPAREIGGDFYDFFSIDEDHFFFVVGDVASKGMPAALFMAVARTLVKSNAKPGIGPELILKQVNDNLCKGNDSSISVTVFCGIINVGTGVVVYSNAGHIPPCVYRGDGRVETVKLPEGMALGISREAAYGQDSITLGQGDSIIVYTNIVNDLTDSGMQVYDALRFERVIKSNPSTSPRGIVSRIMEDVGLFTAGVEQPDDITVLSLSYIPVRQS